MKNILIILGHPNNDSFCGKLAEKYSEGALESGASVTLLRLSELQFDMNLRAGFGGQQQLEPDLQKAQQLIQDANHLVFVYPTWWATVPALLKGFIDRTFLPGFAFAYKAGKPLPDRLLKEKTARLIVTADSPPWYFNLFVKAPGHHMMKSGVLNYCGVSPVKITFFSPIRNSTEAKRDRWLSKVAELGRQQV